MSGRKWDGFGPGPDARRLPIIPTAAFRLAAGVLWAAWLVACADGGVGDASLPHRDPGADGPLLVLAASDLQFAFEELVPAFEERMGERVRVVLGSSGNLATQIRHGAPADLFFSADRGFVDQLVEADRIDPGSRALYARGRIVVVAAPGSDPPATLAELTRPEHSAISLANPGHAPYGRAAREALMSTGVWEELQDRIILGENVSHAYQFVRTGNAEVAIVALSLIQGVSGPGLPYQLVEEALHQPLDQVVGLVTDSPRRDRARALLDFVLSDEGVRILARYGFQAPEPEGTEPEVRAAPDAGVR